MKLRPGNFFNTISNYLPAKVYFKHLSELSLGNVVVLIITLVGYPILSRLYSDIQFGELAVFQSTVIILTQLSTLNYEEALVLIKSETKFKSILTSALSLNVAFSLVALVVIFSLWALSVIPDKALPYIFFLPLVFVLKGNMQVSKYTFIRNKDFKKVSASRVLDRSVFQFFTTAFGFARLSFNFLIIGYIAGNLVSGIYSYINIKRYTKLFQSWKFKTKALSDYSDFPKFAMPSIFLDQVSRQLPVYFITYFISTEITGQYSIAYRVLSIPEMIIGASIGQIFYKKLSELYNDRRPMKMTIRKLWLGLFALGIIPFGVILFYGEMIFTFVFGPDWQLAGKIASYLSPMLFAMFISTPSSFIFTVLRSQKRSFTINVIVLIARTLVLCIGFSFFAFLETMLLFGLTEIILIILYNSIAWKLLKEADE